MLQKCKMYLCLVRMEIKLLFAAQLAFCCYIQITQPPCKLITHQQFFILLLSSLALKLTPTVYLAATQTPLSLRAQENCDSVQEITPVKGKGEMDHMWKRKFGCICVPLKALAATQGKIYALSSHYYPLTSINCEWWEKAAGFLPSAEVPSL